MDKLATARLLIDPHRSSIPPHNVSRTPDRSLQRAYRQRLGAQMPPSGLEFDLFGLQGMAALILLILVIFLSSISPGALLVLPFFVFFGLLRFWFDGIRELAQKARRWEESYCSTYATLEQSDLPLLIASFEDQQLVHESDRETLKLPAPSGAENVYEAMLGLARMREKFETRFKHPAVMDTTWIENFFSRPFGVRTDSWGNRVRSWSPAARARYAAIYDYLFQPQEQFHAFLEQQDSEAEAPE